MSNMRIRSFHPFVARNSHCPPRNLHSLIISIPSLDSGCWCCSCCSFSIRPSILPFVYPSIHRSIDPSFLPSIRSSIDPSIPPPQTPLRSVLNRIVSYRIVRFFFERERVNTPFLRVVSCRLVCVPCPELSTLSPV